MRNALPCERVLEIADEATGLAAAQVPREAAAEAEPIVAEAVEAQGVLDLNKSTPLKS